MLIPAAKAEWDRIVPILLEMQVLTVADGAALAGYCMSYARWQEAEAAVDKHGLVYEAPVLNRGGDVVGRRVKLNPANAIALACQKEMRAALGLFGLDPSSRSRIKGAVQERQDSPLLAFVRAHHERRKGATGGSTA